MSRAALILVLLAACTDGAPRERPGPEGLRAYLAWARREPARAAERWAISEPDWRALVDDTYTEHHADYLDELDRRRDALVDAVRAWQDAPSRTQYSDDPDLSVGQVHAKWIFPVGRAGLVSPGIDAVWVFSNGHWRVILDLDHLVAERAERAVPGCAVAYAALEPKDCAEWGWSIAEGALRDDAAGLVRACRQSVGIGCGQ